MSERFTHVGRGPLLRSRRRIGVLLGLLMLCVQPESSRRRLPHPRGARLRSRRSFLVHGAWADGSSWSSVVERLQRDGYAVYGPPNPLRGVSSDAGSIALFVNSLPAGPVVLVGHSYGGAVITNAATSTPNVKALVYINAFAPDQGESLLQLASAQPGSALGGDPTLVFNFVPYVGGPPGDVDLYVKPSVFQGAFANDLPAKTAAVLASEQRPLAAGAAARPSPGPPAWKTIPSWYLVGTEDHVIPPAEQRFMAARAHSTTVEVKASHLSMISRPDAVTKLIVAAAEATEHLGSAGG